MNKLRSLLQNKRTLGLILVVVIGLTGGFLGYNKFLTNRNSGPVEEIDLGFDAEGPYALLVPRRDGNALILNLKRTSSYDAISYELAYVAAPDNVAPSTKTTKKSDDGDGTSVGAIDRGVVGEIDTKQKKGEYQKEILFGTCSKNVCKYDKGVENGTLTLHIRKGSKAYRMVTQWHIQQPDIALGSLESGDGHFKYQLPNNRTELSVIGFTIINDVTGVPKLPDGKQVFGKVYALNIPDAKELMVGDVILELAENPPADSKLARFDESKNEWEEMDTKIEGSKLSAKGNGQGIFAVLTPKK